jgi:hypothetical protein
MNERSWQDAYKDAVMETDSAKLPERIAFARRAIHDRLRQTTEPPSRREFDDMEGALRTLSFLIKNAA